MRTICVMGMHRSGTSLLMRISNLLGVELGDHEKILPPGEDNTAGYWERDDVLKLNNALLERFGGSWDRPPHLPVGWEHGENLADLRRQALKALESFPDNAEAIGWKDPRLSLLLPFWRSITSIDRTVVALRHPVSVAASLQHRNGFTIEHATSLWVRYTLEALVNAPDSLVLRYSDMLSDSADSARSLAEHLQLPNPEDSTLEQIRGFVQPELAHQSEQLAPNSPTLRFASNLFEEITANSDDRDLDKYQALVATWNESAQAVGGSITSMNARLEEQREQTRRTEKQSNQLRNQQSQLRSRLQETENLLKKERESTRDLERERQRRGESELAAEFERARRRRREVELAGAERRTANVTQLQHELRDAQHELRDAEQRYSQLRGRISVRIALPIAEIVRRILVVLRWIRHRSPRTLDTASQEETGSEEREATVSPPQSLQTEASHPQQTSSNANSGREKEPLRDIVRTDALVGGLRAMTPVSIVIPVYNAADDLRRCVDSVRRNTTFRSELLLIDDASPDPRVAAYLDSLEELDGVRVLRNTENLGFGGTVNRGIRESVGDVVVLNSDTEVTPRWLTNLALAAHEEPTVGSVTPISNNAGAFSVPERGNHNVTPPHLSKDEIGRLVTRTSQRVLS